MRECAECHQQCQLHQSWYVELCDYNKIIRCSECGLKEYNRRHQQFFGYKNPIPIQEMDKKSRVQYAKKLKEVNLSPWSYRKYDSY